MSDTGDGLDHLRIPYDKIKFGRKLESQGYGTVFEGEFDNQRVALKQLNITNLANIKPKLLAEILTISKFRNHPNLVALLGFCDEKSNEITLVYEYVSSGNLEDTMRKRLTTIQRFEICLGAARGLCYLHTGIESITIVHGNIKLSKILLNSNSNSNSLRFEAKISSFGLSKIVPGKGEKVVEASEEDTEKVSEKLDVYSFGVMLLIVLCGVTELVDTDDYEEHHVSVVVPKKMKQNKLRNMVHRDIRKEIKTEALETYAAIACQCVMENPDERPDMVKVVEELEKALILQGGEVTSVQLPASEEDVKDLLAGDGENNTVEPTTTESSNNDQVITKEILNSKTESNEEENESKFLSEDVDNEMSTIDTETTEDQTIDAFHSDKKSIISNENKEDKSMGATSNGENNMIQDTNSENVLDTNHIEDAKNENNIDDPTTENEVLNDSNFTKESNVTVENQEETTSKIAIKDAHNEMSTTDREITEITTTSESSNGDTSNLNQESVADKNHTEEKKEDDKIMNIITNPESSNGDTSTSTSQEVHKPNILKLQGGSFSENNEDELERLRIPFAEIKFGQKIDVRGYGTMYEGLYSNQQVALKRLNITNLHNIKPNLLSAILTIYKFRLHPNVVTLIGFCDESNKELVLVYEYVSGGNLADKMSKHLNTIQRHQICLGAARGLEYLHNGDESVDSNLCIIHGNLKLSKILLSYDSESSNFVAKLSGFGLPKLLPGHVEIGPKSMEKLTKESDVYSFGLLLLEVLCGVPELVDTDDYQERYVTELVPKRLEQNMLRKIVHFDIRDEITNESLETYAKIACRCVRETPEERPSMSEVVIELEKALRLQGGKVSDVQCVGSSNENILPEVPVGEDDHKGEDNVEATSITDIEPKEIEENIDDIKLVEKSLHVPISGSSDVQILSEDVETKNGGNIHDPESTEETTINLKSNEEESNIIDNESNITTSSKSDNGDDSTPAMGEKVSDVQLLATSNGNSLNELPVGEDDLGNDETTRSIIKEEESKVMEETTDGIALFTMQDQKVSDGSSNGNDLVNASVGEDDQQCDDNGVTLSSTTTQEESKVIEDTIDDIALESVLDKKYIVDAKNESSNNDLVTQKEILNDLDLIKESNITVENEEDNKDADNEMSTTNPEVTKENIDDFDSKKESKIIEEYKEDDESAKISTTLNSSNGDTTTSTMEEVHESKILKSDRGSFSDVNEDELERLRISFEEIKFGQKIDARGYGTMFEGEYNNQQVALKRLNITNLHNIKPKLLSAILTIYKFRQHPNLVALIGFCDESNKELILVYEYVSDGNLADKMSKHLNTIQRHQICLGAARGLEYLHSGDESANSNPCIIHGNLKLSKILLNYDSVSSNFVAKVSGFGLPKLLPGHVEIGPKSTEKLTKESDVYSFGVLLLEVLCGVPELVDTDDYQERHVTELVPKRLEQNMLRKIIHFDIRDEITAESLETYARIACRCVRENPEERPTMTEVVIELEKALRLQGGKVSDVHIFGSYGNGQHEVAVGEDDYEGDGNGETMSSKISEEELKVVDETIYVNDKDINLLEESFSVPVSGSDDVESAREEAETKNDDNLNDPERIEETTVDQTSMDDSKICVENEVSNVNMITTESSKSENDDDCSSAMEDAEKENVTVPESIEEITTGPNSNEESKIIGENEINNEIKPTPSSSNYIMEVKNSAIPVGNGKAGSLNTEKPALIVNDRGSDYGNSIIQIQESESKRSNSTSSGSSNGDDTTPTDHLLPQSPDKVKKTRGSGNCYCCLCSCSWLQFISDRVVFYGELFWNKLVSFFTWMTSQCSSKRD